MDPNNIEQVTHTDSENENNNVCFEFSDQELEMMAEQLVVELKAEKPTVINPDTMTDLDKAIQSAVEKKSIFAYELKDLYFCNPDERRTILNKLYRKGVAFDDGGYDLDNHDKELVSVPIDAFLAFNSKLKGLTVRKYDPYEVYLRSIAMIPLLTPEEEVEVARQLSEQEDESAILQLFESNLYLVPIVAWFHSRQSKKRTDRMEMIRVGNEALLKAIATFDYTKGYLFETHAICVIDSEYKRRKL